MQRLLVAVALYISVSVTMVNTPLESNPESNGSRGADRGVLLSLVHPGMEEAFKSAVTERRLSLDVETLECALREGARKGLESIAATLLDYGITVDSRDSEGETPLMLAAQAGRANVIRVLLDRGATINATTTYGWTALFFAAAGNHYEATKMLLEAGADVSYRDLEGRTALDYAHRRMVSWRVPIWGALVQGRVPRIRETPVALLLRQTEAK